MSIKHDIMKAVSSVMNCGKKKHNLPEVVTTEDENHSDCITAKQSVSFRVKTASGGWRNYSVQYSDGTKTLLIPCREDEFMRAFLSDNILRPSCYDCQFKGDSYHSDLTIGDFWGIDNVLPSFNDNKGVSEVIVRSPSGLSMLNSLKGIELVEVSRDAAYQCNIEHPVKMQCSQLKASHLNIPLAIE